MAYGVGRVDMKMREMIPAVRGLATDFGTGTASSGTVTLHDLAGKVTTEALTTAAAAEYTLTITNNQVAAGDVVFASVDALASAGTPAIGGCTVTAGQIIITVSNVHASAAFDDPIQINFFVVKSLSATQLS